MLILISTRDLKSVTLCVALKAGGDNGVAQAYV